MGETKIFDSGKFEEALIEDTVKEVFTILGDCGYNPVNQIVGYILSGDPTYITSYNNARNTIRTVERDELLEEMVKKYIGIDK